MKKIVLPILFLALALGACKQKQTQKEETSPMQQLVEQYAEVELNTDISVLTEKEKQMLPILFEISDIMEELFWMSVIGEKQKFLSEIKDETAKKFCEINYGPWNRLANNKPFIKGYTQKPAGVKYYPADITKEEFEALNDENKTGWYNVIRRDENGKLKVVPYHIEYKEKTKQAAQLLKKAAILAEDQGLKKYLELRADALLTDDYLASDLAWMDMQNNTIDFVVGPIETYEDALFGYKAAHAGQVLIKDKKWSKRLSHYGALLPKLQENLPVAAEYKAEKANANSDLNVYDIIYSAGECNAGSKNIAINLPNDPRVHRQKGSRKLQLKNAMQAKFDKILAPIANLLIDKNQVEHVKFDAFFENVMFHEVAHGLGLNYTLKDKKGIREVLKDKYTSIEECKADILGLYLVTKLNEWGEMKDRDLMDNYVTFVAGIFRSVRFGAASAHGKANMISFYHLKEKNAFSRDETTGNYKVNFDQMKKAINSLAEKLLVIQGDGNYEAAKQLIAEKGVILEGLQKDLDRANSAGIPKDIVYKQGINILGL